MALILSKNSRLDGIPEHELERHRILIQFNNGAYMDMRTFEEVKINGN